MAAAAAAARDGATQEAAIEFGKKEGSKNASSWADIARSGNALANKYNANFPELHGTGRINNANKTKKRNGLSQISPFTRGTSTSAVDHSIATKKPSYLSNKCLVVRGIEKGTSQAEFQTYVNNIAGKPINFLCEMY